MGIESDLSKERVRLEKIMRLWNDYDRKQEEMYEWLSGILSSLRALEHQDKTIDVVKSQISLIQVGNRSPNFASGQPKVGCPPPFSLPCQIHRHFLDIYRGKFIIILHRHSSRIWFPSLPSLYVRIMSLTGFLSSLLITCPYHLSLASLTFSATSTTPHLLISSFHIVSDQFSFSSSYYVSIPSQPCFPHLLCNVYHPTSSNLLIP